MRTLRVTQPGSAAIVDAPIPVPEPDEVLVRVLGVGVCGSDLSIYRGTHPKIQPPVVLGHEIFGVIERLGATSVQRTITAAVGDRVVVIPNVGCNDCPRCADGEPNVCQRMRVIGGHIDGGLADYLTVPAENVLVLPESLGADPVLAIIEPAAVAHHAVAKLGAETVAGLRVAVYGAGAVGLLVIQLLRNAGAEVVYAVDPSPTARSKAEAYGAQGHEPDEFAEFCAVDPHELDAVLECSGSTRALAQGIELVRNGGSVVIVGIQHQIYAMDWVLIQRYEKQLIGAQMYTRNDFDSVVQQVSQGLLDLQGVVSETISLEETAITLDGIAQGTLQGKFLVQV